LAAITPVIFNTTVTAISRFTPLERGCYTENEFKLKALRLEDGYKYSLMNCFYSAMIEKIAANCSCAPQMYGITSGYLHLIPCR
jgi:hypothetical protein